MATRLTSDYGPGVGDIISASFASVMHSGLLSRLCSGNREQPRWFYNLADATMSMKCVAGQAEGGPRSHAISGTVLPAVASQAAVDKASSWAGSIRYDSANDGRRIQ